MRPSTWTPRQLNVGGQFMFHSRAPALVLLVLLLAAPTLADWDPGIPAKWIQEPDLSPMGIDINCSPNVGDYILADDFLCTTTGPVTDSHIWGSWLSDYLPFGQDPKDLRFVLSIHADIPEGQVEEWSMPGDWTCWLYKFHVDPHLAFIQEGSEDAPIVYWLDLKSFPMDPKSQFGWKASLDHWNDDAVWGVGQEPYPGPWFELIYPPGHEMYGQSIDLAFAILEDPVTAAHLCPVAGRA